MRNKRRMLEGLLLTTACLAGAGGQTSPARAQTSAIDPPVSGPSTVASLPPAAARSARPRQAPPHSTAAVAPDPTAADAASQNAVVGTTADAPKFTSEAKWELAGYNNDEVVYTVFVTSQDTRIIRCTTEVKGFYFENGAKLSIADRQITTVFPNQPTRVGYWMDMDQQSGATYAVKCHPI